MLHCAIFQLQMFDNLDHLNNLEEFQYHLNDRKHGKDFYHLATLPYLVHKLHRGDLPLHMNFGKKFQILQDYQCLGF